MSVGQARRKLSMHATLIFTMCCPYLELITRNGLAERIEGGVMRYRTTAKGEEALRCMKELERLMPERGETEEGLA